MNLAVIATVHFPYSHADVITSRWLMARETDRLWGWNGPRTKIVSAYIDQFGADDIGKTIWRKHDVPIFSTIREALTLGGSDLAVDGVLLIGEHGDYPLNSHGQKLYPRKEFFDQIIDVYEASGRSATIFCDKHFSWKFSAAREMVATSRRMQFLLFGTFESHVPHFACLAQVIEETLLTGLPPFPIERTLLTTGMLEAMMQATDRSGHRLLTPHLDIRYNFSDRREVPLLSADQLAVHSSCELAIKDSH